MISDMINLLKQIKMYTWEKYFNDIVEEQRKKQKSAEAETAAKEKITNSVCQVVDIFKKYLTITISVVTKTAAIINNVAATPEILDKR